jgi:hypothetical protein
VVVVEEEEEEEEYQSCQSRKTQTRAGSRKEKGGIKLVMNVYVHPKDPGAVWACSECSMCTQKTPGQCVILGIRKAYKCTFVTKLTFLRESMVCANISKFGRNIGGAVYWLTSYHSVAAQVACERAKFVIGFPR